MSDDRSVLDMVKNAQGIYEYSAPDGCDQRSQTHTYEQSQHTYGEHQQTEHTQYANNLNDIYSDMAARNNEYLKNMRSAFDDSRKRMLDQMQNMTARF